MFSRYPEIPVKRVNPDAPMPKYAHKGDAGLDLCAIEDVTLRPGEWQMVKSGISVAIPNGYVGMVCPRSGMGCKGLVLKNTIGVIDAPYRGEIGIPLFNNNPKTDKLVAHVTVVDGERVVAMEPEGTIHVSNGDRVAQLIILPCCGANVYEVDELDKTERQEGGFGSTGISGGPRP